MVDLCETEEVNSKNDLKFKFVYGFLK